jgi:hypothetical protein
MYGQVHANRVLLKKGQHGDVYRQFAVLEGTEYFEFQINDTDEYPPEPNFQMPTSGAKIHYHHSLIEAIFDLAQECERAFSDGWEFYDPTPAD